MNWLITGGCGFIGRALIKRLLEERVNKIRVLDNLEVGTLVELEEIGTVSTYSSDGGWSQPLTLVEGDIREPSTAAEACYGANVVVHLAANTGVSPSVDNPRTDCETNVIGTLNMLEGCRRAGVRRFVFASSGAPLGVQIPPLHEDMAPHPASPYGASKLAGEGYCSAYYHCFGVETVALRFGNVYGEGSGHKNSVVAKFIRSALKGEPLEIYGDGTQTRDFIHILDLVTAIERASRVSGIGGETFQIATSRETTLHEITSKLLSTFEEEGIPLPKTYFSQKRDGDVLRNYSDTTKAKNCLGWQAKISLEDGLRRTVNYFLNQKNC